MSVSSKIYDALLQSSDLSEIIKDSSGHALCEVKSAIQKGEFKGWAAERIHGAILLEFAERYEKEGRSIGGSHE